MVKVSSQKKQSLHADVGDEAVHPVSSYCHVPHYVSDVLGTVKTVRSWSCKQWELRVRAQTVTGTLDEHWVNHQNKGQQTTWIPRDYVILLPDRDYLPLLNTCTLKGKELGMGLSPVVEY